MWLCFILNSVEELCEVDLYDPDTNDGHAKLQLLLSACEQLHESGILCSVLHNQVSCIPNEFQVSFSLQCSINFFLHLVYFFFPPGFGLQ